MVPFRRGIPAAAGDKKQIFFHTKTRSPYGTLKIQP